MSDSVVRVLTLKNYVNFIRRLPGSTAWNHLYAVVDGIETDVTANGDKSCAYVVSSVLALFGLSTKSHATVKSTLDDMKTHSWYEITKPVAGCVIEWDGHIGFYINEDIAISSSSISRSVSEHQLTMSDGSKPIRYWSHRIFEAETLTDSLERDPTLPTLKKGIYRHSKSGRLYEVIAVTFNTETNEPLVLYKPLYDSRYEIFARPYNVFTEQVSLSGELKPRFEKTDD